MSTVRMQSLNLTAAVALLALAGALASTPLQAASGAPGPSAATAASAASPHAMPDRPGPKKRPPAAPVKQVNLNTASRAELKTLPGIGDAEADKILANRPFLTKSDLVTKKIIPVGPYLSLKSRVTAWQPAPKKSRP